MFYSDNCVIGKILYIKYVEWICVLQFDIILKNQSIYCRRKLRYENWSDEKSMLTN